MSVEKLKEIALLEAKLKMQQELPHLYGFKFYPWARQFFDSTNRENFLCSGNQVSKSSTQIRKVIHWATSPDLWPKLWPGRTPRQFWYLYPTSGVATVEVDKKWIPEFLPRGTFKDHPIFGWHADYRARFIEAIHFNTGVSVYFKTYAQNPQDLQTGTCDAIFFDEELPIELMPELQARLFASNGYMHGVFTPTLGQEYWRETMEVKGSRERHKGALKLQVSMYDCLKYDDGTPSFWTPERIRRIELSCKSQAEIDRRVHGKFVLDSGLKYPSFDRTKNIVEPKPVPKNYSVFVGVDSGSGGDNHPSAITFVAVRHDYRHGIVFKGRRLDNMVTTASDLVQIVQQMKAELPSYLSVDAIYYDHAATDLREIAGRMGEGWIPAEKSHAIGEQVLNVLFKNGMLEIQATEELQPLVYELLSLKLKTPKNQASDDYCDALRYSVSKIPWDWSAIGEKAPVQPPPKREIDLRREAFFNTPSSLLNEVSDEIDYWNDLYG